MDNSGHLILYLWKNKQASVSNDSNSTLSRDINGMRNDGVRVHFCDDLPSIPSVSFAELGVPLLSWAVSPV